MSIRVVIVDDHAILRAGLRRVLEAEPDIEVVGEAPSADRAVFESAARQALSGAKTTPDNAFKVPLGERVIVRALEQAGALA